MDTLLKKQPELFDGYGRARYQLPEDLTGHREQTDQLIAGGAKAYVSRVAERQKHALAREVHQLLGARPATVLEIGGGTGHFFDEIRGVVELYVNVDPTMDPPGEDEQRRLRDPRYRQLVCSATDIPLLDGSVDMTIALASLDHIADHRRALAEMARVTRPRGFAMVVLNNRRSWWKVLLSGSAVLRRREEAIAREHYIQLSIMELISEVSPFFRPMRSYTMTFLPYIPIVWPVLLPLFDVLGRFAAPRRGANSILICERT